MAEHAVVFALVSEQGEVVEREGFALLGVAVDVGQQGCQLRNREFLQLHLFAADPLQFFPCPQHHHPQFTVVGVPWELIGVAVG